MRLTALLLTAILSLLTGAAAAQPVLTVCLEEDSPPLSFKFRSRQGGFDHGVAEEVAKRIGRGKVIFAVIVLFRPLKPPHRRHYRTYRLVKMGVRDNLNRARALLVFAELGIGLLL